MANETISETRTASPEFRHSIEDFGIKIYALVQSIKTHSGRIHAAIEYQTKYKNEFEALHVQWLFVQWRSEQLDADFEQIVRDYKTVHDGFENWGCDLELFAESATLITGDALEDIGMAEHGAKSVMMAVALADFAHQLHDELYVLIGNEYASPRRAPVAA